VQPRAWGWTSSSGSCNAGAVAVRAENKADTYAGTSRSPATSTHSSAAFGNFGRIGTSVAAVVVAGGWTSCSGSCNAGAVAVRAENKAGIYAGTSRSPATSTHSSAAFGNFGRIGASVAAVVGGGQTSRTRSCNAGAVAVRAEDKVDTYAGTFRSPATSTHSLSEIISFVRNFGRNHQLRWKLWPHRR
jgi:hypothetical protein